MPTYDFCCELGHMTEKSAGYDDTQIVCPLCGGKAYRQAVYAEQYTITETGAVVARKDRVRRDHMGEKLEILRKNSVEAKRETNKDTGPMKIRDWEL